MANISRRRFLTKVGAVGLGGATIGLLGASPVAARSLATLGQNAQKTVHVKLVGRIAEIKGSRVRLRADRPQAGGIQEMAVDDAMVASRYKAGDYSAVIQIGDRATVSAVYDTVNSTIVEASDSAIKIGGQTLPVASPTVFQDGHGAIPAAAVAGRPAHILIRRNRADGRRVVDHVLVLGGR